MAAQRLFPPLGEAEARLKVEQTLCRRQELYPERSRWTLDLLREACLAFLRVEGRGAFKRVLKRLSISYQRARTYFHSPDVAYDDKLAYLRKVIASNRQGKTTVLFQDELTYYNHASPAPDHSPQREQPKAGLAIGGERGWRIAGALDIFSGQFISVQRSKITVPAFVGFLRQVVSAYPGLETIYLVVDNWPVHFHPDVMEALQEQQCPFPFNVPASWKKLKPSGKYKGENLPIQFVPLPTYSPWLNPVEKIWRWLKKDLIHNHSFANEFKELKVKVEDFLCKMGSSTSQALAVAGLLKPDGIYADQLRAAGVKFSPMKC